MDMKKIENITVANFKRDDFGKMFHEKGFTKGVEVGVYKGEFSEQLCKTMSGVELYGVDDYDIIELRAERKGASAQHKFYKGALKRTKPFPNYKLLKKTSMAATLEFPLNSIDFVYIDGGHGFDYVMADLIEWGKRVKKGGIISGHDYYHFVNGGIVEAVEAYTCMHGVKTVYMTDERVKSFWFFKDWE